MTPYYKVVVKQLIENWKFGVDPMQFSIVCNFSDFIKPSYNFVKFSELKIELIFLVLNFFKVHISFPFICNGTLWWFDSSLVGLLLIYKKIEKNSGYCSGCDRLLTKFSLGNCILLWVLFPFLFMLDKNKVNWKNIQWLNNRIDYLDRGHT